MADLIKTIRNYIGEASEEDKETTYKELEGGAKPDVDYFLMTALACIMATLGLLINNVSVIIGAMLIAPLMTSIVAMALGIVKGDIGLFLKAVESETKGILLVVIIAVFITIFSPFTDVTPEIQALTAPNLFYLLIAIVAGTAGAYTLVRPKLNSMLPGVAMATAVLPPLATVGIGLGLKRFDIALGALLLFLTNIIAINLASTIVFWVLGIGSKMDGTQEREFKENLKKTILLCIIISIPLTWIMINTLDEMNIEKIISQTIEDKLIGMKQTDLVEFEYSRKNGLMTIEATIRTADERISQEYVDIIKSALEYNLKEEVDFTAEIIRLQVYEANDN